MGRRRYRETREQAKVPVQHKTHRLKLTLGIFGIVLLLGLLLLANRLFAGSSTEKLTAAVTDPGASAADPQVVKMAVNGITYEPSSFTVQANRPVQWVIDGSGTSGCTQFLVAPTFGVSRRLTKGENIVEFTPTQRGTFGFSCSMGMAKGSFNVV